MPELNYTSIRSFEDEKTAKVYAEFLQKYFRPNSTTQHLKVEQAFHKGSVVYQVMLLKGSYFFGRKPATKAFDILMEMGVLRPERWK